MDFNKSIDYLNNKSDNFKKIEKNDNDDEIYKYGINKSSFGDYGTVLQNKKQWLDLSNYYYKLVVINKDDLDASKRYLDLAERCIKNYHANVLFDRTVFPDLIPADYSPSVGDKAMSYGSGSTFSPTQDYSAFPSGENINKPYSFKPSGRADTTEVRKEQKSNPYNFSLEDTSEEDKLASYIEADLPVFIHGKSGCGKSARIKEMDPDCTILYLGSARPETLQGKSIVKDNELVDVPPVWYEKLVEKCEKEPDKIHILFLDECTNALPSIQGYAFNLVLDKEVNGKWKLPSNCRIVAAGNEDKESTSANKLSEPMFRRFNHIYIETTLQSWLLWASKHNIHPAIYAFVASRGDGEHQILRSDCDGINPCVDPRKWEMASTLLKKSNRPSLLSGVIGPSLTSEFIEFCKKSVITLDEVLHDSYDANMPVMRADEALATLIGLSSVDENNVKKVRDFVKKYMIPEQYQNFVRMWTLGDKKRIDLLQELDMLEDLNDDTKIDVHFKEGKVA